MKTVLITGVSSGVGKATAEYLATKGYAVYGASRRSTCWQNYTVLSVDVRSASSVAKAVSYVLEREGTIDVLINNAGVGIAGALEETAIEDAQSLFDTNLFGVARLTNAVIGTMRSNGGGLVINVSSLAGKVALPFQGYYSASKSALEAYANTLRMEVERFNVSVVNLQLGDLVTKFTENRKIVESASSVYWEQFQSTLQSIESDESVGRDPLGVAKLIHKIILKKKRRSNYSYGKMSQILSVRLKPFVPERLYWKLVKAYYNVQ